MDRTETIEYLMRDGGKVPCSRYGRDSAECAPAAYAAALILAAECDGDEGVTEASLDYVMGLVVNDHDDPAYLIINYGLLYGLDPAEVLGTDWTSRFEVEA